MVLYAREGGKQLAVLDQHDLRVTGIDWAPRYVGVVRTSNCNSLLVSFSVALDKLKLQTVIMNHP